MGLFNVMLVGQSAGARAGGKAERFALSAITAEQWWRYEWVEVTTATDSDRMFSPTRLRTPNEAAKAKADVEAIGWDAYRATVRA